MLETECPVMHNTVAVISMLTDTDRDKFGAESLKITEDLESET